ncbi:MAG: hypothetical protein ABEJ67_02445 [Halanaeroarchaeum sp.]
MGLFNDLGQRVERFKQQVAAAADETYECVECGEQFHADYDTCPECGADAVELVETE